MTKRGSKSFKLYHGTTEALAKQAPVAGVIPYNVPICDNGIPRALCGSTADSVCLTSIYPGYLAFETCGVRDRWGLIEIDVNKLQECNFLPYEGFLLEKSKKRIDCASDHNKAIMDYRTKLGANKKHWRTSLEAVGLCMYQGTIPATAIAKVTIYDWRSNWMITKEILHTSISIKSHKVQSERQKLLTRWLLCEQVTPSDWVSNYAKLPGPDRDRISSSLHDKSGLDIFYQQYNGKGYK